MGSAISEVLPFAVGVATSPIPIIAVILVLFSTRARANGPAFLLGWVVGLVAVCAVVYSLADTSDAATDPTASDTVSWGKVVLGGLLLVMAARKWRGRPAPGEEEKMPAWMADVEDLTPVKAVGLGIALSAVNPKNLILTAGAAAAVAQSGVPTDEAVVVLAVFVVLASVAVAGLVGYHFVGGESARGHLDEIKAWMSTHNSAVMTVLLLVFGTVLVSQGLGLLTA